MSYRLVGALLGLLMACAAQAGSVVATVDTLVAGVSATAEALSDATSSLRDSKVVRDAQDDASAFVASGGTLRGAYLEAALLHLREQAPALKHVDDGQLAQAIISR